MQLLGKISTAIALSALTFSLAAPASAAGGPCSLLTQAEAAKYLGTAVGAGKAEHASGGDQGCRWSNASHTKNVYVTVDSSGDAAQQIAMLVKTHAKSVPGVGYWMAGTLFMKKGNALLTAAIYKNNDSMMSMDAGLPSLGRLVLSRY